MDSCPSVRIKAIAIKNTMSYRVPTEKPFFSDITKPGESYPFNNNIMNLISLGTPLLVMHISADKAWFLVSNCRFSGWVPTSDVAFVDENFIKEYTNNELFVAIDDDISLLSDDSSHRFLSKARMGVILPCTKGKKLLVPYMKDNGYAGFKRCSNHSFVKKPYAFTGEHIIEIAKKFLGTKYGWGGYLEDRDCSMMIRDFATIFGIFLPCGSGGMLFSKGHKSITGDKDDFLKKNATPFLTIVGTKGHVMIYVGTYKGKPILWHNIWGMRLGKQELGRYVIGKTVLTDLGFCGDIEDTSGSLGQKKADTMFDILRK
jgi:hypothetical protein